MKRIAFFSFLSVFALFLLFGCSLEQKGSTKRKGELSQCQTNRQIDPYIRMHMLDFGNKIARAVFQKDPVPVLSSFGISEREKDRVKAVSQMVEALLPSDISFDTGKVVFLLWISDVPKNRDEIACNLGNAQGVYVHIDRLKTAGNPTGILAYRFGTKEDAWLLVVECYFSRGVFMLSRLASQQVSVFGKDASYLTAAAETVEQKGDKAIAALMYETASKLLPDNKILQSFASKRLKEKAEVVGKNLLPSVDSPKKYECLGKEIQVQHWQIVGFRGKSLLEIEFVSDSLEEYYVRNIADCITNNMRLKNLGISYFDALLFRARNTPVGKPGDFLQVVEELK